MKKDEEEEISSTDEAEDSAGEEEDTPMKSPEKGGSMPMAISPKKKKKPSDDEEGSSPPEDLKRSVERSNSFIRVTSMSPSSSRAEVAEGELFIRHGIASIQGRRKTQEDAHFAHDMEAAKAKSSPETSLVKEGISFFAVYDGHGGQKASEFCAKHLHKHFQDLLVGKVTIGEALLRSILKLEKEYTDLCLEGSEFDGSTITAVVIQKNKLVVANVGDSEAVLCRKGKALQLADVHNPGRNEEEGKRVIAAGGRLFHGRVGHPVFNPAIISIAVSRSIGDVYFKLPEHTKGKKSGLIADPDIKEYTVASEDTFIILACDGLWDVLEHQIAVDMVNEQLKKTKDPNVIAKHLVERAYALGSMDNITCLVILLERGTM